MIRICLLLLSAGLYLTNAYAQEKFAKIFGGKQDEHAMAIVPTYNGDYVTAGFTYSYGEGKSDIWIMKMDEYGEEIWRQYFGHEGFDWANDLIQTRDGNFVVAGYTQDELSGKNNAWVFQINRYGELMWSQTYGGEEADEARSIIQTADGGFAVAGFSYSYGKGKSDIWLLRLNAVGEVLWDRQYGSTGIEKAYSITEIEDEGFLIGGFQHYPERDTRADMLLVRTDRNGKGLWRRTLRQPGNGVIESVKESPAGKFLAVGWAYSTETKSLDARLLQFNRSGTLEWEKDFGGAGKDALYDIEIDEQGDYIMVGQSTSFGAASDGWMIKCSPRGEEIWQKVARGEKNDYARDLALAKDGGYIVAGGTKTYASGGSDMWILKTDNRGNFEAGVVNVETLQDQAPEPIAVDGPDIFKPNLYILSVGVSKYEDESASLDYAHTDAGSVAAKFATQEGKLYNKVHVKQYLNEEATLVNVKTGISWLEKEATQKDMILVYISAHGALDNKGNLYILPTDYQAHNLFATALNIRDLTEGMNATPCKKLIFLDACHSGQSGYDLLEFASIKALNLNRVVEELIEKEPGVTVITSSSQKEFSYENPIWGHGAFTKAILEALDGMADFNRDEVVNLAELNLYISDRVKELTEGRQHPYMPINLFGSIPLFILN